MRNAALILGVIAGLIGLIVGFFGYGYTELAANHAEVERMFGMFERPGAVRTVSVLSPILALAGGGMAKVRALWGGALLLLSAAGMYYAFGFNPFTMFPITLAGLAGILAIAAGKPDEPKAHF